MERQYVKMEAADIRKISEAGGLLRSVAACGYAKCAPCRGQIAKAQKLIREYKEAEKKLTSEMKAS